MTQNELRVAEALYDNMCLANPHVMVPLADASEETIKRYLSMAKDAIRAMSRAEPAKQGDWDGWLLPAPKIEFGVGWAKIHYLRELTDDDREHLLAAFSRQERQ